MSRAFSVTDLYVAGTVLDLVGGYLIARGLLVKLRTLVARAGTYVGSNSYMAVGAVEDRVDARAGLVILGCGFLTQALGYEVTLALNPKTTPTAEHALIALGLAVVAGAAALGVWWQTRDHFTRSGLIQLACVEMPGDGGPPIEHALPDRDTLARYGFVWRPGADGEPTEQIIFRVFGEIETRSLTSDPVRPSL